MPIFIKARDRPAVELAESLKNGGVVNRAMINLAREHPTSLLLIHWSNQYPSHHHPHPLMALNSRIFWIEGFGGEWIQVDRATGCAPGVMPVAQAVVVPAVAQPVVQHVVPPVVQPVIPPVVPMQFPDFSWAFNLDAASAGEGQGKIGDDKQEGGKVGEVTGGGNGAGDGVNEGGVVVNASQAPPPATMPLHVQMLFQGEMNGYLITNPDAEAHHAVTGGYDPNTPPFAFFTSNNQGPLDYDPDLIWILERVGNEKVFKAYRLCSGDYDPSAKPRLALEEKVSEAIKRWEEWNRWLEWKRGVEGGVVQMREELAGRVEGGLRGVAMELAREANARNGESGAGLGGANTVSSVSQGRASQPTPTPAQLLTGTHPTPNTTNPNQPSEMPPPLITNIHSSASASAWAPSPAPTAQMLPPNTSRSAKQTSNTKKRKEDVNFKTSDQPLPRPPHPSPSAQSLPPPNKTMKSTPAPRSATPSQKRKRSPTSSSSSVYEQQEPEHQPPSKKPRLDDLFEVPQYDFDLLLAPPTPNAEARARRPSFSPHQQQDQQRENTSESPRIDPFEVPQRNLPSLPTSAPAPFAPRGVPVSTKARARKFDDSEDDGADQRPSKRARVDLYRQYGPAPNLAPAPAPKPAPARRRTAFITPASLHQQSLSSLAESAYSSPAGPQPALRPPPPMRPPPLSLHQQRPLAQQHRPQHYLPAIPHQGQNRPAFNDWMARQHATVAGSYSSIALTPTAAPALPLGRMPRPSPVPPLLHGQQPRRPVNLLNLPSSRRRMLRFRE